MDAGFEARAQLAAFLAASRRSRPASAEWTVPGAAGPAREAAVLVLFGPAAGAPPRAATEPWRDVDVLLLARADTLRQHPGQVAFPGGRVDPGDDGAVGAALREAREETGLDPQGVEILGRLRRAPLAHSGHLVTPVVAWWRRPSAVRVIDEAESAAVFRVPVATLLDPANRGVTVLEAEGKRWRGPAFAAGEASGNRLIWGFTGILLDRIFAGLGWSPAWDRRREFALPPEPGR